MRRNRQKSNNTVECEEAYVRFSKLLDLANSYRERGDYASGLALAQIAARYAFPGTVGLFASPQLEKLLLLLGGLLPAPTECTPVRTLDGPKNILHILSYGRPIGGDSRFAWRWIQEDRSNRHFVVLTCQDDVKSLYDVPDVLRLAAEASGGWLQCLRAPASQPANQAVELRSLCQGMDIAVLHLFPYDIVPIVALARGCDSVKTLFINHSDHTFWLGGGVAHRIVHLRKQKDNFLTDRRRLRPDCASLLPIPLPHVENRISAEQAKRALGYDEDVTILLTIASPFKYQSPGAVSFLDLVEPVITRSPRTILIAVGPRPDGAWKQASLNTGGRIVPLGTRWDNELLYCAADVYLDSVPFSSITSLLEAGARGIPLLGLKPPSDEIDLLGAGAPGLEQAMLFAADPASYQTTLSRLLEDPLYRRAHGDNVKHKIASNHTGHQWLSFLTDVYLKIDAPGKRGCLSDDEENAEYTPLAASLEQLYPALNIRRLLANHLGQLPFATRVSLTWQLYKFGLDLCFLNFLPSQASKLVRQIGSRAKYYKQDISSRLTAVAATSR